MSSSRRRHHLHLVPVDQQQHHHRAAHLHPLRQSSTQQDRNSASSDLQWCLRSSKRQASRSQRARRGVPDGSSGPPTCLLGAVLNRVQGQTPTSSSALLGQPRAPRPPRCRREDRRARPHQAAARLSSQFRPPPLACSASSSRHPLRRIRGQPARQRRSCPSSACSRPGALPPGSSSRSSRTTASCCPQPRVAHPPPSLHQCLGETPADLDGSHLLSPLHG